MHDVTDKKSEAALFFFFINVVKHLVSNSDLIQDYFLNRQRKNAALVDSTASFFDAV